MAAKKSTKKSSVSKEPASKPEAKRPTRPRPIPQRQQAAKPEAERETERPAAGERYWEAVGRRKTAVARVRLFTKGDRGVWVNARPLAEYFGYPHLSRIAEEALETMKTGDRFRATVKVSGGGLHAQAEAIRHGTARALVLFNSDFRKRLKRAGFLTRDPRMKERKKFGLKGARRAPQWAKR